jgi:sodium bicarbonate transporter 10
MWIAAILIILVAIDASVLVCYITRFTEENFATLIAFIFIYKVSVYVLLISLCFEVLLKLFIIIHDSKKKKVKLSL